MRIDEATVREIRARTDLAALIGAYVPLRKRGNDLVGLCPFHAEKSPSFHVHPDRGFFKCFGCGAGGDVITFFEKIENLAFPEAARALARRAGVEVEAESPATARVRSEKEAIVVANELASRYFARMLAAAEGGAARAYCEGRGISAATVEAFRLGFAPARWDGLVGELVREGVDLEIAAKAGLVKHGQHGFYDFYRGRLMIPTFATTGEVIAFGGRSLDGGEPKYLNTSTTPVYTKGRGLYALERARRHVGERGLIVVEGYLDCIALHQAGFSNAVASLGTSFTPQQAAELRKYTEHVYICFDADAAGSAATAKSIDVLQAEGCTAHIVQLPPGEDPDSFVRTHGSKEFTRLLDSAIFWAQEKVNRIVAQIKAEGRTAFERARRAEDFLAGLPALEADRWRIDLAQQLGVSPESLRASRVLADPAHLAPRGSGWARPAAGGHVRLDTRVSAAFRLPAAEREILAIMVEEPALVAHYAERIPCERFGDERLRAIYERLLARADTLGGTADVLALYAEEPTTSALLLGLLGTDRSASVRFADTQARREQLERIIESFSEADDLRRKNELGTRIDERIAAGMPVPHEERDEYRRLVEDLEFKRRRRLAARVVPDRKEVS